MLLLALCALPLPLISARSGRYAAAHDLAALLAPSLATPLYGSSGGCPCAAPVAAFADCRACERQSGTCGPCFSLCRNETAWDELVACHACFWGEGGLGDVADFCLERVAVRKHLRTFRADQLFEAQGGQAQLAQLAQHVVARDEASEPETKKSHSLRGSVAPAWARDEASEPETKKSHSLRGSVAPAWAGVVLVALLL